MTKSKSIEDKVDIRSIFKILVEMIWHWVRNFPESEKVVYKIFSFLLDWVSIKTIFDIYINSFHLCECSTFSLFFQGFPIKMECVNVLHVLRYRLDGYKERPLSLFIYLTGYSHFYTNNLNKNEFLWLSFILVLFWVQQKRLQCTRTKFNKYLYIILSTNIYLYKNTSWILVASTHYKMSG